MPGGRSNGCKTCKLRRIKCDERTPICVRCEKSRRHCTGPDSPFRYQYGTAEQHAQLIQALDSVSIAEDGRTNGIKYSSTRQIFRNTTMASTVDNPTRGVPLAESELLAASLISALDRQAGFGQRLQQMGSHFRQLPPRLGQSRALDAAVSCFLFSFTAVSVGQPRDQSMELAHYCNAISCLRQELTCSDPVGLLSTPSETLCASLLLAQYEVLKPGPAYMYITLAGGVSAILKACGPTRATSSDFELSIFNAQYPNIILQCLLRREECFLRQPEWVNAMRAECSILSDLWIALVNLPDVLIRSKVLDDSPSLRASQPLYADLLSRLCDIRAAIVAHSDTVTRSLSTPGVAATYPRAYRGSHPVPAFRPQTSLESLEPNRSIKQATFYHACVVLINTVLQNFLPSSNPALSMQTSLSATYILEILNFAIMIKPFGSLFMTFAGPLCYGVLTGSKQREMLLQCMKSIFDEVGIYWTHLSMQEVFYALTQGGWRKDVTLLLTEKRAD